MIFTIFLLATLENQWITLFVKEKYFFLLKRKNGDKDGKALYKLMNNAIYGKTMKNLRNRIDVRLVNNKKDFK